MFCYTLTISIFTSILFMASESYAQTYQPDNPELCQQYPEDVRCLDPASKLYSTNLTENLSDAVPVNLETLSRPLNLFGRFSDIQYSSETIKISKSGGGACRGYFSFAPSHSIDVGEEISFLGFKIDSEEHLSLRIIDPNQGVRCLSGQQPYVLGDLDSGVYDIYVGSRSFPENEADYVLTISNAIDDEDYYANFLLSPGFTPEIEVGTGLAGGAIFVPDTIEAQVEPEGICSGFINRNSNHVVVLDNSFEYLGFTVRNLELSSLVIRDAINERIWCESGERPTISGEFSKGTYEIFVGNPESSQTGAYYQLLISELSDRQLLEAQERLLPAGFLDTDSYASGGSGDSEQTDLAIDIDWDSYLSQVQSSVEEQWSPSHSDRSVRTVILFEINRDGSISDVRIGTSGNNRADASALEAVEQAAPFSPLPADFFGESIDISFEFELNVTPLFRQEPLVEPVLDYLCREFPYNSRCVESDSGE